MLCVLLISDAFEVLNNHSQIVCRIIGLFEQVFDAHIKQFDRFNCLSLNIQVSGNIFEFDVLNDLRDVFEKVSIVFERSTSDHTHVSESITNSSYQLTEPIQICYSFASSAKSLDVAVHVLSPFIWIHVSQLVLLLSPVTVFLHQWLSDEVIVKELVEHIQLLYQELVEGVNHCAHHANSMCLDRVVHLIYSDSLYLFGLQSSLYEHLRMQIVIVP